MTLEELIKSNFESTNQMEYRLALVQLVDVGPGGAAEQRAHIIVHPMGIDGETLDFTVDGNNLIPINCTQEPENPNG